MTRRPAFFLLPLLLASAFWPAAPVRADPPEKAPAAMSMDGKGPMAMPTVLDRDTALAFSQAAIGRQVGDYTFTTTTGASKNLAAYRGKPLIISLIYTSCYHICPRITQSLARVIEDAQDALGDDAFNVVTIGFDTKVDTPTRMASYQRAQGIDLPHWDFLSTDAQTVNQLARDLGFIYMRSPKGFDHLAQTTILNNRGEVATQIYGIDIDSRALIDPLKTQMLNTPAKLTSLTDIASRIHLFCTIYDPTLGRYRFDYSIFVGGIIGFFSLLGVAIIIVREWRRGRKPS